MSKQTLKGVVMFGDLEARQIAPATIYLMFDSAGKSEIQIHDPETDTVTIVGKDSPVVEEMANALRNSLDWVDVGTKQAQTP